MEESRTVSLWASGTNIVSVMAAFTAIGCASVAGAVALGRASALECLAFAAAGFFSWTIVEYSLHRFSFHATRDLGWLKGPGPALHQQHHRMPHRPEYLGTRVGLALPYYALFASLFWIVTRDASRSLLLGGGLALGYALYEWVHFSTHYRAPVTRLGRYLKKYHMLHHYQDTRMRFGVTTPFWDIVFGTY